MDSTPTPAPGPPRCVRHGGTAPVPSPTCPDCPGGTPVAGTAPTVSGGGTGTGTGGAPAQFFAFDPDPVRTAANRAAGCADALHAALGAARGALDAVPGRLRTVAALRTCVSAQLSSATALAEEVDGVSVKLGETIADYARRDADLAALLTTILPA